MQQNHDILIKPLRVPNTNGHVCALKQKESNQSKMGIAISLDSIVNSIDAELIATGPSAKGPNRGAIVRHGRYVLWGFEGPVSGMTDAGKKLFVNTVVYTAMHARSTVLEKKTGHTRDSILTNLNVVARIPAYLNTMKARLPESLKYETAESINVWFRRSRPYLRQDREGQWQYRWVVDEYAKKLGMPNHRRGYLEACIANLKAGREVEESIKALVRYTGNSEFGTDSKKWSAWYAVNRDYLFFSDCDGFVFKVDEEAKRLKKKTSELRKWSSETLDYMYYPKEKGRTVEHPLSPGCQ